MKNLLHFLYIACICVITSCSNESIENNAPQTDVNNPDQPENTVTTPCAFDLSNVVENSTIIVDCVLDLKGQVITLPTNVNFDFDGGDIVGDGTLIFSGGTIDGRLLSKALTVQGDVKLKDPTFKFYAVRWDIVEGTTTTDIALKNNAELERLMFHTKELGATVFEIGNFDAYFEVTKVTSTTSNQNFYPALEAVNIPSDFHLRMSENTHLRIFPAEAGKKGGSILAVRDQQNIIVSGGTLHGDRDQRIYSPSDNGLEGSHLFTIRSGRNVVLDGLKFVEGSSGSLNINSFGFSFNPDYNPTKGITIKNCTFTDSRRMALVVTDARDVLIEGNAFIDTGLPSTNSDGGEVGYAINIEPDRFRDDSGVLFERQKVFDVIIRKNTETGSRNGFVTATIGQDITIEDNDIGTRVVYSLVSGNKIINNRFKATGNAKDSWAIFAAGGIDSETVFDNEIAGNLIDGYSLGITSSTKDAFIHDNTITNCGLGIQISKTIDSRFYDNSITVTGYGIAATNTFNNNIELKGNTVVSGSGHVYFVNLNNTDEHKSNSITLQNNIFSNSNAVVFSNSNGIIFNNNDVNGGVQVGNTSTIEVSSNTITPNENDGVRLFGNHTDVTITNNTISKPTATRYDCINNDSETPNAIIISGNQCN